MVKSASPIALVLFLICSLLASGFAPGPQTDLPECGLKTDTTLRLAVMSAFGAELALLLEQTQVESACTIAGRIFTTGVLRGHDVVLFLSGVSMTNAAMTTQQAVDHFNLSALIFSGISGGVNPRLHIGDVYVAERWAEYQENFFVRELSPGEYQPPAWFTPVEANFGMMFPQPSNTTVKGGAGDEVVEMRWFYADPWLMVWARMAGRQVELESCTAVGDCLADAPRIYLGGSAVSGPTFVDNAEYRDYVYRVWRAWGLDMESAAAAHVLYANDVPFLFVRSASDLAGGDAGENPINIFFQLAANNSARFLLALLDAIP
ncbi:MAG: 5'-methylthioadenosine/S-adenosylhomocysteine nucleosidase [Anaerolineales bacterium]